MHPGLVRGVLPVSLIMLPMGAPPLEHQPFAAHSSIAARRLVISGRVTDSASKHPAPNAYVSVVGTRLGAMSDSVGRYRIVVPDYAGADVTVLARRIGYVQASRVIRPGTDTITVDFALAPATLHLSEVVVTARQPR